MGIDFLDLTFSIEKTYSARMVQLPSLWEDFRHAQTEHRKGWFVRGDWKVTTFLEVMNRYLFTACQSCNRFPATKQALPQCTRCGAALPNRRLTFDEFVAVLGPIVGKKRAITPDAWLIGDLGFS